MSWVWFLLGVGLFFIFSFLSFIISGASLIRSLVEVQHISLSVVPLEAKQAYQAMNEWKKRTLLFHLTKYTLMGPEKASKANFSQTTFQVLFDGANYLHCILDEADLKSTGIEPGTFCHQLPILNFRATIKVLHWQRALPHFKSSIFLPSECTLSPHSECRLYWCADTNLFNVCRFSVQSKPLRVGGSSCSAGEKLRG